MSQPPERTTSVCASNGSSVCSGALSITITPAAAGPTISSVSPNPVTGSTSPQTFTINGTGFTSSSTVTLGNSFNTYPNMPISSRSSTQLVINPTFGTTAATWYAKVIDGSQSSSQFSFNVVAPTVTPTISF